MEHRPKLALAKDVAGDQGGEELLGYY